MLAFLIISIVVLVVCAGLVVGLLIHNRGNDLLDYDGQGWFILGIVLGFIALASTIALGIQYPVYLSSYEKHVVDIMSISRGDGVTGSFCLGSGTVKDVQYYFYYYNTERGVSLGKVECDKSYIVENDQYNPSIYEIKEPNKNASYYRVYVPTGTIITTYVLN